MLDLPLVSQPFPDDRPWFDLSQYLAPGLVPRSGSLVAAQIAGNTVTLTGRITVTSDYASPVSGGGYVLMSGLPEELRVAGTVIAYCDYSGEPSQVVADSSGRVLIPTRTGQDPALRTLLGFTITGLRKV